MYTNLKKGDLVRYRKHHNHGFFVITSLVYPNTIWLTMVSLKDGKEYVDLSTSMEKICEKKLDKSSDRVSG